MEEKPQSTMDHNNNSPRYDSSVKKRFKRMFWNPWNPGRQENVCCGGLGIEHWNIEEEDDLAAFNQQSRRDYLLASIESSGIGSAEHLRALSLQQLEDMYRMNERYDEIHFQQSSDDDSDTSFPLQAILKVMGESEKLWFPFSFPLCSCYDIDTTTSTVPAAAYEFY